MFRLITFFSAFILPLSALAQINSAIVLQAGPVLMLPAGANPSALAIADFNTDGKGDVAVCERGLNSVAVHQQTTAGTFAAIPTSTYAVGNAPSGLVVVNITGSSNRPIYDLVAISGPSSRWTFLTNTGTGQGTFTTQTATFGTAYPSTNPYLATAFLNQDNLPDFAYTYDPTNRWEITWKGYRGGNSFSGGGGGGFATGFAAPNFTLADFNQDGAMDITFPNPVQHQFRVLYGVPGNTQTTWYDTAPTTADYSGASTQPVHLAAGDVNGDSRPDLAVANAGSQDLAIWLNNNGSQFGSTAVYPLSAAPRLVLLADLNGDSRPELLTITADNQLQVFRHTGITGYGRYGTPVQLPTGTDPTLLQVADMDGDLVRDIVVGCIGDNTVRVYYNRSLTALASAVPLLAGAAVYPNPATDYLRVETSAIREPLQATLLDLAGRTVYTTTLTPDNRTLPVTSLPRGLYLLRLANASNSSTIRVTLQ